MNEIVAAFVDDIDCFPRPHRGAQAVERGPHVDVDDENAERRAVRRENRCRDAQRRYRRHHDHPAILLQIEGRDIEVARRQLDRLLEEGPLSLAL